jgi:hypothetical protein
VLEGCRVLGHLAEKAERTFYLDHRERLSLLCALGHLGEEGSRAVHAIISHTYNYKFEVTERHVRRLPEWPISCPKLKELHPEAVARGGCDCPRKPRERGYPTPLLLAVPSGEINALRKQRAAPPPLRRPRASSPPVDNQETPSSSGKDSEEPPAEHSAGTLLPGGAAASSGRLVPSHPPGEADIRRRAEEAVRKLAELKRHQAGVEASIHRVEEGAGSGLRSQWRPHDPHRSRLSAEGPVGRW